jgi:tetratricopeptide (TPR) repeat protein
MTQPTIEDEGWSFFDWIQANSRAVSIGAALVVVAGIGFWFYVRSNEIKRLNAERGLNQAKQSLGAGNAALAMNDLQRVATRYTGTSAGSQAAMLLAQLNYQQGKYAEGIKALEPYHTARAAGPSLGAIWALTGDGQIGADKLPDALTSYQKAVEATSAPAERATYLAKHAKALMLAGKDAEALVIWERLAADPDASILRNEAKVRIGELTARPAGKS